MRIILGNGANSVQRGLFASESVENLLANFMNIKMLPSTTQQNIEF
jgi:hypothetical protein